MPFKDPCSWHMWTPRRHHRRNRASSPAKNTRVSRPPRQQPQQARPLTPQEILHENYLEKLELPTLEQVAAIAKVQERNEEALTKKYRDLEDDETGTNRKAKAAGKIQRTYRGHRERRQMNGWTLDPSTRWQEAIKEAQFRKLVTPHPRRSSVNAPQADGSPGINTEARQHWHRLTQIARHARGDEPDNEDDTSSLSPNDSINSDKVSKRVRERRRRQKDEWKGMLMDLPYFLEMLDLKHRYGSNLRIYHAEWKTADTHDDFFYWLDYGGGKDIDLQICSREQLEREKVRYLSREERMSYQVQIDKQGRLRWKRNGVRIDTTEEWRDSIHGIVPKEDETPIYRAEDLAKLEAKKEKGQVPDHHDSSDEDDEGSDVESEGVKRYADSLTNTKGPRKILHVSPATILNSLMRKSVKKNTWIFVADMSMNIYVGIKQSGGFQHSSFLHGCRISAAGLIKIKDGQIRSLSPLSGHYRPPASAFRHFLAHLHALDVDMSRVHISKSFMILMGLESYIHTKAHVKHAINKVERGVETVVRPEEAKRKKEKELDESQSAKREREVRERENDKNSLKTGLKKFGVGVGREVSLGGKGDGVQDRKA